MSRRVRQGVTHHAANESRTLSIGHFRFAIGADERFPDRGKTVVFVRRVDVETSTRKLGVFEANRGRQSPKRRMQRVDDVGTVHRLRRTGDSRTVGRTFGPPTARPTDFGRINHGR